MSELCLFRRSEGYEICADAVMLRIGRAAGSITPTTSPPNRTRFAVSWFAGIRSVVISPARLSSHFGLSCFSGCATRGFPSSRAQNSAAFAALRFFALAPVHPRCSARLRISHDHVPGWARRRVDNSSVSGQTQSGFSRPWALSIRSGVCLPCGPALHTSLYAPQGRGNHSHAPKYAFLNCVLLPYRIGRSDVPLLYDSGKNGICPAHGSVGQTSAALRTTASQNLAAIAGGHTLTEAVLLGTLALLGLIGTKHGGHLLI